VRQVEMGKLEVGKTATPMSLLQLAGFFHSCTISKSQRAMNKS